MKLFVNSFALLLLTFVVPSVATNAQALRRRDEQVKINGNEWLCRPFDVDLPKPDEEGNEIYDFCTYTEEVILPMFPNGRDILNKCCRSTSGDEAGDCCLCNRQMIDNFETQVFQFYQIGKDGECNLPFPGGGFGFPADIFNKNRQGGD